MRHRERWRDYEKRRKNKEEEKIQAQNKCVLICLVCMLMAGGERESCTSLTHLLSLLRAWGEDKDYSTRATISPAGRDTPAGAVGVGMGREVGAGIEPQDEVTRPEACRWCDHVEWRSGLALASA